MRRARVIDSGSARLTGLRAAVRSLDGTRIKAGIFGPKGEATYPESGLTVAEVAQINEFGTADIPARPFLRSSFDEKSGEWTKMLGVAIGRVLDGKASIDGAFGLLRAKIVGDIQTKIVRGPWVPNAASTIARKGSANPLRDTDTMLRAVSAEILRERDR